MIGLIIVLVAFLGIFLLGFKKDFWNAIGLLLVIFDLSFCIWFTQIHSENICQEYSQKIRPKVFQYDSTKILVWKHSGNFEEKFLKPSDSGYSKAESIFVDTCSGQLSE
jgi:hypothetical protein